jgi:ferredoxin--NADP+ reductase
MTIACGLVVSAIGYEAKEISELPLENGRVVNVNGRVSTGLYVVGWAKRGPSGVIGTNKSDSTEVVALIAADLTTPKEKSDISELLVSRKIKFIKQTDWSKLNEAEVEAGQAAGKPRIKFTDRKQIDSVLEVTQ